MSGSQRKRRVYEDITELIASPEDYRCTRERLSALRVTTIFPGHGPVVHVKDFPQAIQRLPFYMP